MIKITKISYKSVSYLEVFLWINSEHFLVFKKITIIWRCPLKDIGTILKLIYNIQFLKMYCYNCVNILIILKIIISINL